MPMKIKDRMTLPEARVASALEELGYLYEYEREAVLKYPSGYETVRYPDFYLPELDLYLEGKSMRNSQEDIERYERKLQLYEDNGIEFLEIDPAYTMDDGWRKLKSLDELKNELQGAIKEYVSNLNRDLPEYSSKRLIDDFSVYRDGVVEYTGTRLTGKYCGDIYQE